ncbi:VanZ family protein [Levilactobacillus humaensis]|uniref:VanZ family protein n=1 Tax=Levilactobacillus humaensis TaxID=2950375 RepID=UPI0021C4BC32|nr:VanZ family protein [Levilactobacillus humaensis]
MTRWLPFMLASLVCLGLVLRAGHQRSWPRVGWWIGCWVLVALTWIPVTVTFGSQVADIQTFHWANGTWVLWPLQPAGIDASFWLNIVMTIPQGMLWQWNFNGRWPQWLGAGLATGLTLETGQAIGNYLVGLGRWVDINDVLTNALGVLLGALIFAWGRRQEQLRR